MSRNPRLPRAEALAAKIRTGGSGYYRLASGTTIRISDHERFAHHLACEIHADADIHVVLAGAPTAEEMSSYSRGERGRAAETLWIPRRPRERWLRTAARIRSAVAGRLLADRLPPPPTPPPAPEEIAARAAHEARWTAIEAAAEPYRRRLPPLGTPGRAAIRQAIKAEARLAGLCADEIYRIS